MSWTSLSLEGTLIGLPWRRGPMLARADHLRCRRSKDLQAVAKDALDPAENTPWPVALEVIRCEHVGCQAIRSIDGLVLRHARCVRRSIRATAVLGQHAAAAKLKVGMPGLGFAVVYDRQGMLVQATDAVMLQATRDLRLASATKTLARWLRSLI
jgi:hypothetical protein